MEDTVDLWTVVQVRCRARTSRGLGRVVLSRRDVLDLPALAAIRDRATALRRRQLESAELHDVYELEVADGADDLAVRRLFSPTFVVFLVERAGQPLFVELHRQTLTVAQRGRLLEPADLDRLLGDARRVAAADRAARRHGAHGGAGARGARPGARAARPDPSIAVGAAILVAIFVVGAVSISASP